MLFLSLVVLLLLACLKGQICSACHHWSIVCPMVISQKLGKIDP